MKSVVSRISLVAILAASAGLTLPAHAQFAKPEDAVKYRKGAFQVMAAHFSRIGAMAQGKVPFDAALAKANADLVATMAALPFAAFPEGTAGTDKGTPKATVWTERAKFDDGAKQLQNAAAKLQAAAQAGGLDGVKAAFGDAAKACKSCHDDFRN